MSKLKLFQMDFNTEEEKVLLTVVNKKQPPERNLQESLEIPTGYLLNKISSSTPQNNEVISAQDRFSKEFLSLEGKLSNQPIFSYRWATILIKGEYYSKSTKFILNNSNKDIKKKLLWKALFSQLTLSDFLVLDHCIQVSWRESDRRELLEIEVLIQQSLSLNSKDEFIVKLESKLPTLTLSARLISLTRSFDSSDTEKDLRLILKKKLELPDSVSKENLYRYYDKLILLKDHPPKPVVSNSAIGKGSKKNPNKESFQIESGTSDTTKFDLRVLEILRS